MRNTISAVSRTASVAALLAVSALAYGTPAGAAEPARANFSAQAQLISDFCNNYPGASSCSDWQQSNSSWTSDRYQSFYRDHRNEIGLNTTAAAAAFGRSTGSAAPSQDVGARTLEGAVPSPDMSRESDSLAREKHVNNCLAAFPSYNLRTDSFTAEDGTQRKCTL
jgi:hypothetical protein